jgi:hypothetical protein
MKIEKEEDSNKKEWKMKIEIGDNMFWLLFWIIIALTVILD